MMEDRQRFLDGLQDWEIWNSPANLETMRRIEVTYAKGALTTEDRDERMWKMEVWRPRLKTKLDIASYEAEYGMDGGWQEVKALIVEGDGLWFFQYKRYPHRPTPLWIGGSPDREFNDGFVLVRDDQIIAMRAWQGVYPKGVMGDTILRLRYDMEQRRLKALAQGMNMETQEGSEPE